MREGSEPRCLHFFIEIGQNNSAGEGEGMLPSIFAFLGPHAACSSYIKPYSIIFSTGTDSHHYSQRQLTEESVGKSL